MTPPATRLEGGALALAIAVICAITAFTRAFPFLFFSGARKPSALVLYLGRVLPPAIIALLVVYSLKDAALADAPHGLPEAVACLLTVLLQRWKRNAMISIGVSTVVYMILIQVVFL
jgi:branched-subunit amino acid transport protein AzlD